MTKLLLYNFACPHFYTIWFSLVYLYYYMIHISDTDVVTLLGDGNVKNSVKKFSAAKLLRRKDTFYRNLLGIVKSYHRVRVRF